MKKSPLKQLPIILLILLVLATVEYFRKSSPDETQDSSGSQVEMAFKNRQSDVQVRGGGKIVKLLADDLQGSRHQKFIVRINDSLTILMAHNIDLAPRIDNIKRGEDILFYGEYEYNKKGGVVHWTHHDPGNRHIDGWLKYKGEIYQ